jgi:D-aminoacyl-tRNA deacylase
MRAVVQRVSEASVTVDGKITGSIGRGLLVLIAVHRDDTDDQLRWMADKLRKLRIFEDEEGKMNRSVEDVGGGILLVSQFTLYGELKKGTRPSFTSSAGPEQAEQMYDRLTALLKEALPGRVGTGIFAAKMDVSLVNDGPVTIIMER